MISVEQKLETNAVFSLANEDQDSIAGNILTRKQDNVLHKIRQCTDIILITSNNRLEKTNFISALVRKYPENIRSLHLNSNDFISDTNHGAEDNSSLADFSLVSSFIYESTKFDEHLVITIDDADNLPQAMLDDIAKLGENVNLQKNKVSFLLAGSPSLLSNIEKLSNIRKLGIAHCTLDEMVLEDIIDFIESRQEQIPAESRLVFDANALKTITTHAGGNMLKASVLLEWCREYSISADEDLVTVDLVKKVLDIMLKKSQQDDINQFVTYPDGAYDFTNDINETASKESKTSKGKTSTAKKNNSAPQRRNGAKSTSAKISGNNVKKNTKQKPAVVKVIKKPAAENVPKIYERVMDEKQQPSTPDATATDSKLENSTPTIVENIVMQESKTNVGPTNTISISDSPSTSDDSSAETYNPIYLENTDLSLTRLQSKEPKNHSRLSALQWTLIISISCAIIFYVSLMTYQQYGAAKLAYKDEVSLPLPEINKVTNDSTSSSNSPRTLIVSSIEGNATNSTPADLNNTIQALLKLAQLQMQANKLTTPEADNAYSTYTTILALDNSNPEAIQGIRDIQTKYIKWADNHLLAGNKSRARQMLLRAAQVTPGDIDLMQRIESLNH